ncbi:MULTISPECIES: malonic semialdehyde reductase [Streptosporangium]|uniref:3-hydroxypropanoate dehydrogenase n=1 Tax=Streptosporangium brasiliense TaxID=47480 RepID=A0ABT9R0I5_9ACTN|nr:malonic semialdehyde reductase [Streptosporangium brasiliense]MDP9861985.1 3-hydroxypropanoate dehydrogenase [Streptosporangium brasiliense]
MALVLSSDAQNLLFRDARTANTFTDEPVSDEQIRAIYDLVKYAPTAMNQQPLRIVLVRSPEARERLIPLMSPGNQAKTAAAPLVAILAADLDFHEELPKVFPHATGARDMFAADEARRAHSARFNATLQLGYFILGVRAAGLAAGPMAGYDAAGIDKEFLDDAHTVLAVVNIGRPGENAWFDRLPRLSYEEVVTAV